MKTSRNDAILRTRCAECNRNNAWAYKARLITCAFVQLHEDDEILTVWSVDESDFTTPWTAFGQVCVPTNAVHMLRVVNIPIFFSLTE